MISEKRLKTGGVQSTEKLRGHVKTLRCKRKNLILLHSQWIWRGKSLKEGHSEGMPCTRKAMKAPVKTTWYSEQTRISTSSMKSQIGFGMPLNFQNEERAQRLSAEWSKYCKEAQDKIPLSHAKLCWTLSLTVQPPPLKTLCYGQLETAVLAGYISKILYVYHGKIF